MFHLLPFAIGLLAGAAAVKMTRKVQAGVSLGKAQDGLRRATIGGLDAIEQSSARLRARLATEPAAQAHAEAKTDASLPAGEPSQRAPARKSRAKSAKPPIKAGAAGGAAG